MHLTETILTADTEILELTDQETIIELPTLPIKAFANKEAFEDRVRTLRQEYDHNRPAGIFF